MKRDELLAKGYTEEQVTDLLNTFHSINAENNQLKANITTLTENSNSLAEKINGLQKQIDEENKAKLTEQEQIDLNFKQSQQKLDEANKIYNRAKAKEILAGLNVSDTLLENLVSSDEKATIANANEFLNQFNSYKSEIEKKTRESITNIDAKPQPTNIPQGEDVMTPEKFKTLSMMEQKNWKDNNLDAYNQMFH